MTPRKKPPSPVKPTLSWKTLETQLEVSDEELRCSSSFLVIDPKRPIS